MYTVASTLLVRMGEGEEGRRRFRPSKPKHIKLYKKISFLACILK
jgi:hypothetical protein